MSPTIRTNRGKRLSGPPLITPPTITRPLIKKRKLQNDAAATGRYDLPRAKHMGMQIRFNKSSGELGHHWVARSTQEGVLALKLGYFPRMRELEGTIEQKKEECRNLQQQMLDWLRENDTPEVRRSRAKRKARKYDGTLESLIILYFACEYTSFATLRHQSKTRELRRANMLRVRYGNWKIKDMKRKQFFEIHRDLREEIGVSGSHGAMGEIRRLIRFGIDFETDSECLKASETLKTMRFETPRGRQAYITVEMVNAFRSSAHAMGHPVMALAQAIQFESALRQKDVIGEWVPDAPQGTAKSSSSRLNDDDEFAMPKSQTKTWSNGLIWDYHINHDLIMVKPTSKSGGHKSAMADWNMCPMIMEELQRSVPADRRTGPVVVNPATGLPFVAATFGKLWREIARDADIPSYVCNMDSRAGAITEGSEAGADLEHLRQFATHSNASMTQHYNRATLKKARIVHEARAKGRTVGQPQLRLIEAKTE